MEIKIEPHTIEKAAERGASLEEIFEVLNSGIACQAKNNRLCRFKVFDFDKERNGKFYPEKRVEVIYILENNVMVTVTVYVFYGKWEG